MNTMSFVALALLLSFANFSPATQKKQIAYPLLGIENDSDAGWKKLKNYSFGLIMNHTSKDKKGNRTVDILLKKGIRIITIFVPEHGMQGSIGAQENVHNSIDKKTGIPIVSLYGNGTGKKIDADSCARLDGFIFDIQDAGMRHYTYISTLLAIMQAAQQYNKQVIVLDRPNSLGERIEGPCSQHNNSFIACPTIPLRYGLTIGELARYFNAYVLQSPAQLTVIPMNEYTRNQGLTTFPFTKLSPNIPTKQACYCYSFLGLLGEVRPLDIGLGSDHPMEYIGLPEKATLSPRHWFACADMLKTYGVDAQYCRYYSARKKKHFKGLRLTIKDINKVASFEMMLSLLKFFKTHGIALTFSRYFDVATGSQKVRDYLQGSCSYTELSKTVCGELAQFFEHIKGLLLYNPLPKIV